MNQRELIELVGAWLVVSVAFGWVMRKNFPDIAFPYDFAFALLIALVATGTGFILHELAHKYMAIRYGAHAEFYAWPFGLVAALLLSFGLGFVFAAPGAVYIFGDIDRRQNGIVSVAGPAVNIAIGALFFVGYLLTAAASLPMIATICAVASQINLFLALFNLIPVGPLDGSKVLAWNKIVWTVLFLPLLALFFFI
jgi:Zn-dependent protease